MLTAARSISLSMLKTTVVVISSILYSSVTFEKGKDLCADHLLREIIKLYHLCRYKRGGHDSHKC